MKEVLIVAAGSGAGGVLRYAFQSAFSRLYPFTFPAGTFSVNIAGCFLIGLFFALAQKGNLISADTRLFLMTGFCGGFTTFSSFSIDNIALLRSGHLLYFVLYALGSVLLGILATYLGMAVFK